MKTPRAIAAGAVVGFYFLELSFVPAVRHWSAIALAAGIFGFFLGYVPAAGALGAGTERRWLDVWSKL